MHNKCIKLTPGAFCVALPVSGSQGTSGTKTCCVHGVNGVVGALPDTTNKTISELRLSAESLRCPFFCLCLLLHSFVLFIANCFIPQRSLHRKRPTMLPFLLLSVLLHSLCPLCITHPNGPHTLCSFTNVANCMKPLCKRTFTYSEQQPQPKICMCHDQICIPRGHSL